jgi:hypothetical protein
MSCMGDVLCLMAFYSWLSYGRERLKTFAEKGLLPDSLILFSFYRRLSWFIKHQFIIRSSSGV